MRPGRGVHERDRGTLPALPWLQACLGRRWPLLRTALFPAMCRAHAHSLGVQHGASSYANKFMSTCVCGCCAPCTGMQARQRACPRQPACRGGVCQEQRGAMRQLQWATCQPMRLAARRASTPYRPAAVRALAGRCAAAGRAVLAGCCPCTACLAQACLGHPPQLPGCPAFPLHLPTSGLPACPAAGTQPDPPPAWSGARTGAAGGGTAAGGGACQAPEQGGLPAWGWGRWIPGWGAAGVQLHRGSAGQGRHTPASVCVDPCHKAFWVRTRPPRGWQCCRLAEAKLPAAAPVLRAASVIRRRGNAHHIQELTLWGCTPQRL